jgi:amino acid transporter
MTALLFVNPELCSHLVFGWFVNLVSTFGAITWMCIVWTHM